MNRDVAAGRQHGSIAIDETMAESDGVGTVRVRLAIPASSRVDGGPIELRATAPGIDLTGLAIDWFVTTNRGWAHARGSARAGDGPVVPFRFDLFDAPDGESSSPDLLVIRVYSAGADPAVDGPVTKLRLELQPGTIRRGG